MPVERLLQRIFPARCFECLAVCLLALLLLLSFPAAAQGYVPYRWVEADLALLYPAAWDVTASNDKDNLLLTLAGEDATITLAVLPVTDDDAALRLALEQQIAALDLLPLNYSLDTLYGRRGLRIEVVNADRSLVGVGRWGRLPDSRALLITGRVPAAERAAFDDDLRVLMDSLVFGADVPPVPPTYRPVLSVEPSDPPAGWLAAFGGRLYTLEREGVRFLDDLGGVSELDAATGEFIELYSFENPARPTGIAVDGEGMIYIGDTVCRCVRRLTADGEWLPSVGSFGGNAPFSLAVSPDGTIYAIDKDDSGYVLQIIGAPRTRTVGLSFNASAPPLVAVDGAGQAWVVEWLGSLIDGSTSGAVSAVNNDKAGVELRYWVETLAPESVNAVIGGAVGELVFATVDQGILFVDAGGGLIEPIATGGTAQALAFSEDGTLYALLEDGTLQSFDSRGGTDRVGRQALALGVPVQGALSEESPFQTWTYEGTAGETVTISAVDLTRTDAFTLGLDMALRLTAPDGSLVAENDDQLGDDLFGVYDAQISSVALPQTGTYTVTVEWAQGSGTYTLGISAVQPLEPSAEGVTNIDGRLQDVFPVQRWAFTGREGEVLTFTMTTESGTLDPVLTILKPDGSLLAYNDDARDPELGVNAQITQVTLPADGTYMIEAERFEGAGEYRLVTVSTV